MTLFSWLQIGLYLILLILLVRPLGAFMARVYQGERTFLTPAIKPIEGFIYRITRVSQDQEMDWKTYAGSLLLFNLFGLIFLFILQLVQGVMPLNPNHLPGVRWDTALNAAVSFVTNTNWQSYSGETTMSYFTQMVGMTVQNFLSAATGMAVLVAMVRGFLRHSTKNIGNFWVDMTRGVLYILLPLSIVFTLILVSQGAVQTFSSNHSSQLVQSVTDSTGNAVSQQTIAVGPAASEVAIKQLGTNGGGYFNTNSAHPFENPTPLSNFLEMLALVLIPAALCYSFGKMVSDKRQGWALFSVMTVIFIIMLGIAVWSEQSGNSSMTGLNVNQTASSLQSGGNMEGKEVRFGTTSSALWATATAATSNGSVNSMHDSFNPLGGLVPMWLMQLGEVVYGGVGSGLYGMLAFVIIAVFVAGLMIGRTPEYLGKKIESYEMKAASLMVLIPVVLVLLGSALTVLAAAGKAGVFNPGAHGFSEILYAFSSAANNNGSAFAGLQANSPFYNVVLAVVMLLGRFGVAIPALAIAGSLASKKKIPVTVGTLPTHTPLFSSWLIAVIVIVGALSFIPALSLGPIVEFLMRGH
ncbi:MAG TPA: potassium-transporting ATPase subunit KdpA [Dehalococcoidales bacterium]|nr:potassium-transporting ATPase subunit KdpA [Dehalococcoidales bacterium]